MDFAAGERLILRFPFSAWMETVKPNLLSQEIQELELLRLVFDLGKKSTACWLEPEMDPLERLAMAAESYFLVELWCVNFLTRRKRDRKLRKGNNQAYNWLTSGFVDSCVENFLSLLSLYTWIIQRGLQNDFPLFLWRYGSQAAEAFFRFGSI